MSRILTINYTSNPPVIDSYAGEIGENRAVTLKVFPETDNTNVAMYVMNFAVEGGILPSRAYDVAKELDIELTSVLTQQEILACQLVGLSADGETTITKTPIVKLYLGETLTGEVVVDPETGDTIYDEIAELKEIADTLDLSEYAKVDDVYDKDDVDDLLDEKVDKTTYNLEKGLTQSKINTINTNMDNIRMSVNGVSMRVTTLESSKQDKITETNKLDYSLIANAPTGSDVTDVKVNGESVVTNKVANITVPSTTDLEAKKHWHTNKAILDAITHVPKDLKYIRDEEGLLYSFEEIEQMLYSEVLGIYYTTLLGGYVADNKLTVFYLGSVGNQSGIVAETYTSKTNFTTAMYLPFLTEGDFDSKFNAKQDKLTSANAGDNITINNGIISATGGSTAPIEMVDGDELVKDIEELYTDYEAGKKLVFNGNEVTNFVKGENALDGLYNWIYHDIYLDDDESSASFGEVQYGYLKSCYSWGGNTYTESVESMDLFSSYLDNSVIAPAITTSTSVSKLPTVGALKNYVDSQISSVLNTSFGGDS